MQPVELPKPKRPDHDFLLLAVGSVVEIAGVKCCLQYIHPGKRRLTFAPLDPRQAMPVVDMKDPVTKMHRRGEMA